jgi:hypothetical protein
MHLKTPLSRQEKMIKKTLTLLTSQHVVKAIKKNTPTNTATSKQVNKATKQQSDMSTMAIKADELKTTGDLERKTIYLKPEIIEIFKYAKYKEKIGESQFANVALENYIIHKYGKNWKELLK